MIASNIAASKSVTMSYVVMYNYVIGLKKIKLNTYNVSAQAGLQSFEGAKTNIKPVLRRDTSPPELFRARSRCIYRPKVVCVLHVACVAPFVLSGVARRRTARDAARQPKRDIIVYY